MSVDDVSPWPQADRVNPTQGELAEDRLVVDQLQSTRIHISQV